MHPFKEHPPDRVIADDDIAFLDLGPIFEEWEADFGRTFVLGDDPGKTAVRDALPRVWQAGHDYFDSHSEVTGAELFDYVVGVARAEGFEWGSPIAGHLVGEFPHKKIAGDGRSGTSHPARISPCAATTAAGGRATGSSRSIWSTARAVSAGFTSSCSICPDRQSTGYTTPVSSSETAHNRRCTSTSCDLSLDDTTLG
ncbi:MAG: Xaa-Pro dipeptidase [Mycobacterium sp.]|nr:Xaa-Pro dipeptidase [Mycobacterium sp.]